jgi:exodeoxyribonuclease V alpha subunit
MTHSTMDDLSGKIDGVFFSNAKTGFYILKVRLDKSGIITVYANAPGVTLGAGVKVKFSGKWEEHPTYGKYLRASSFDVVQEKGRVGIITYLSSHVPSIGPITAAKLYDALGDDLVSILETNSDRIRELPFLTKAQSEAIVKEWKSSSENRTTAIFLTDLGLNGNQIRSVWSKYGADTREKVRADPYCLFQCYGVGFPTADSAARKLGVGSDDQRRVCAMISYALTDLAMSDGHMYATTPQILECVRKLFRRGSLDSFSHGDYLSEQAYYPALMVMKEREEIHCEGDNIYLASHWHCESKAAESVSKLLASGPMDLGDVEQTLTEFEKARGFTLGDDQRTAFLSITQARCSVISGFPGTGKTLLISAFVHLFEKLNLHYVLLSPTGIAAKRLSQVTGRSASTIHRALGFKEGGWEFNELNKYHVDAVIVDETSMVDGATFYHLVSALHPSTLLILVGDPAQLPSVGAGYVLQSLTRCPDIPHVSLTRIYRQERQSDIVNVAHSILQGKPVDTTFNRDSEFVFFNYPKEDVVGEICKVMSAMKAKAESGSDSMTFQVIAPMYDGELGVNNLNRKLRDVLNPEFSSGKANKLKHGDTDIYEGDRVMVTKNDYDRMVFNGDVGKVTRISTKDDVVEVRVFDWFDHDSPNPSYVDKVFSYTIEEARQVLKVAYASTCHRTQGNEFDYVILPMTMQYGIMLYRNLVYTAITRARKKVFLFGDPRAFMVATMNDRETVRNSDLSSLISKFLSQNANRSFERAS